MVKKLYWQTTFGKITVTERRFLENGRLIRPFCQSAEVQPRGYSHLLQRRITDFGSDVSFGRVPSKLKEHYGIEVPLSSARNITENHARRVRETEHVETEVPEHSGVESVVVEADGSMIPIVTTDSAGLSEQPMDRRKTRKLEWKEARLSLAYCHGNLEVAYDGTVMGDVDDAGDRIANCAIQSGAGQDTHIHCVGDGARWIVLQTDRVFGLQSTYLVDFYHLCDYLWAAAQSISPDDKDQWVDEQKKRLKEGKIFEVMETLEPHVEPDYVAKEKAPVRTCYNYMANRPNQFGYKETLDRGLPIGSGAIESAHRSIIQDRLKLAGSWWTPENAHNVLGLRTLRANNRWESYWDGQNRRPHHA